MGGHNSKGLFPNVSIKKESENSLSTTDNSNGDINTENNLDESIQESVREILMNEALTQQTRDIINELYRRGAATGDGGTADAIREEMRTGKLSGGLSHIIKGKERARQIKKILDRNPDHPDKELLKQLLDDLNNALGGQ